MNRSRLSIPKRLIVLAAAAALVGACATSPTGRSQLNLVSDAQLAEMGGQAFAQIREEKTVSKDARVTTYVNCVADSITRTVASDQRWEVVVFQDDSANAFALPGGHIGVHTGLLAVATNQHQLAAVIGHEIAHVTARHSAARVSNQIATQMGIQALAGISGMDPQMIALGANLLIVMPYGRSDESEADAIGLDYMANAGFNPQEAVTLWQNMAAQGGGGGRSTEFLSTHPAPATRIRDLERRMPQAVQAYQQAQAQGRRPNCPVAVPR